MIVSGTFRSQGIFYVELLEEFESSSAETIWVFSIAGLFANILGKLIEKHRSEMIYCRIMMLVPPHRQRFDMCLDPARLVPLPAPFSNSFAVRFSSRAVVMTGGILVTAAFLLSSFSESLIFLYFSYGALAGKYTRSCLLSLQREGNCRPTILNDKSIAINQQLFNAEALHRKKE